VPLTVDSILQENSGGTVAAGSVTVSLPSGTTAGSTLLAFVAMSSQSILMGTLPSGWVKDYEHGTSDTVTATVYRKPASAVAAGETSWTFPASSGTYNWSWYVCEVAGLDADDPLDASASNYVSTTVTAAVARSTGTTGANSGTDTVVFGCWYERGASATTAPGTWSGYTNGFIEVVQQTSGTGGAAGSTNGLAIARKWSGGAATGPYESTATYTPGTTTGDAASGLVVAYRAADSPMVNPLSDLRGFEQGTANGLGGFSGMTTSGTAGTNITVQASSARATPSAYGCRFTSSAAVVYLAGLIGTTVKSAAVGFDVRVVSGSGTVVVAEIVPPQGNPLQLVYDVTNTRYGLRWGAAGTVAWQSGTTALNTWVWVDLAVKGVTTGTRHGDWRLETGAGTYTAQSSPTDSTEAAAAGVGNWRFGANASQTVTFDVDNFVAAKSAGTFPLGPHTIQLVKVDPAGTPTVNGTVGNFALLTNNATGAALTSGTLTSARDGIDEVPPNISTTSDGVLQVTAAATDYLQFPMDTFTVGTSRVIAGAAVLAPLVSTTGAGAGALGIRGWDGTAEAAVYSVSGATPGSSTTTSITVPPWGWGLWNPVNGWTQGKLDAAALRFGFSGDATPDMGVHAMYLEVATRPALTARQISVEDDLFTVDLNLDPSTSASVSYVVTSSDAVRGATFDYSLAGVPQTSVYVAASTAQTVNVQAASFGDVDSVTLTPDPA
jgi:hypothetical protein